MCSLRPFFSLEGVFSWLCFIRRWTFDFAATWLLPHRRMHRRSYCNLLWQTNWLPAQKKKKIGKGKYVLWTYWDAEESTSWEKCFLYEKSLNIKVGEVKLATLPSSLKTPAYESVLMFFKVVTPWNKNQELLFFPPQYNKEFYLHMSWLMSTLINTVQRNKSFIVPLWSEER